MTAAKGVLELKPPPEPEPIDEEQCQLWQHSLHSALKDPNGYAHFYRFLQSHEEKNKLKRREYSRYLDFWKDCESYKISKSKSIADLKSTANDIYEKYLSPSAKYDVALDGDEKISMRAKEVIDGVNEDNDEEKLILLNAFDDAVIGMRKYLERGGCRNAYKEWADGLKADKKKRNKFRCRLM